MKIQSATLLTVLMMASAAAAAANEPVSVPVEPHITVPRIAGPLVVDGNLGKPEWQTAAVLPDLAQISPTPGPGEDVAFRTEVRLLRDDDHLYVAVHALDPHPEEIQLRTLRRDGNQDSNDHVTIVLDTFRDHRYAYVFRINTGGARNDGLLSEGSGNPDFSWDGSWQAKTRRVPGGWDMEIAFSTRGLQFRPDADEWGFNILRYTTRDGLTQAWTGRPRSGTIYDLKREGVLDGMEGMRQGSGLEITPYILARSDQLDADGKRFETGGEVKYNVTPQLSATLTVNTDFAETEADSQQINLTRFSIYFPEKRTFFLDGSSLFAFNGGPLNGDLNGGFIPFYSRTVGLANGRTVPIDEGVKVVGRAGDLSMGVLDVDTGNITGVPATNLAAARFAYNPNDQLQFGTLVTNGNPSGLSHESFVGLDTGWHTSRFLGDKNLDATGWAANTGGTHQIGNTKGWGFDIAYPNIVWNLEAQYNMFGDAFDPTLGFLPRPGTRQYYETAGYYFYPDPAAHSWVQNYTFAENYNRIDDLSGHTQSSKFQITPFTFYKPDGTWFNIHLDREQESLSTPFQVDNNVTIPVGDYDFDSYRLEFITPTSAPMYVDTVFQNGQFYGGHAQNDAVQVNWSGLDGRLEMLLYYQAVFAHLPQGHFVQRLWQLNGTYSFTSDFSISSFVQYDTSVNQLGFNTRLHWIIADGKDLYVVWNRNWRESLMLPPPAQGVPDVADTVIVKLGWSFRG